MIIKLYAENTSPKNLAKIVHVLREGGLIVYPTDTVYAFGCDALNVRAIEKICKIRGINPQKSNLSIICRDLSNISEYAHITNSIFKLMKRNLPGPFTFILNANNNLPKIYKNRKEVGIRVPDNPITLALAEALGNPLLTASVRDRNDFTQYSTDPELIDEEYGAAVDLVVDGGYGGQEPSTVVDCTGSDVAIVRQGKGELIEN
ncbi:MAG: threonylcarbamoyl-AMP synthase [Dysgonamonadaceae bacterium]|jgi:tRNA threonylcarbamoyl adenosine modification protein (Sua5/YciO/YrdC/YwlC family)|nr:threonylcarbamoyl-AMP synthase [Dysgonamonadaceae bacterium]